MIWNGESRKEFLLNVNCVGHFETMGWVEPKTKKWQKRKSGYKKGQYNTHVLHTCTLICSYCLIRYLFQPASSSSQYWFGTCSNLYRTRGLPWHGGVDIFDQGLIFEWQLLLGKVMHRTEYHFAIAFWEKNTPPLMITGDRSWETWCAGSRCCAHRGWCGSGRCAWSPCRVFFISLIILIIFLL